MKVSNEILISAIRNFIHNEKDLIPLLMSLLNLGKQSVYRRLRNEIPFTFEEVTILSSHIGFSVDEIMSQMNRRSEAQDISPNTQASQNPYIESKLRTSQILENARKHENSRAIAASNRWLPHVYTTAFENIIKMDYYKWYLQQQDTFNELNFKDFKIPPSVMSNTKNLIYNCTHISHHTLILDQNMMKPIIKEIVYYYKRGLISDEELQLLQEELLQALNELELLAIKGEHKSGSEINIYLSSLNIESNCILLEYEYSACFLIWFNSTEPITVYNNYTCSIQKRWLQSLKKYSTLITQCNEFSRSIFFKKQREQILKMKEEKEVYL